MNNLKEFCEVNTNWEIHDNRRLHGILYVEKVNDDIFHTTESFFHPPSNNEVSEVSQPVSVPSGDSSGVPTADSPATSSRCPTVSTAGGSTSQPAVHLERELSFPSVQLRPFLHPEMIKSSQCEIRLLLPPRHHLRIVKIVVISVARCVEVYDRLGDYLVTVKGDKLSKQISTIDHSHHHHQSSLASYQSSNGAATPSLQPAASTASEGAPSPRPNHRWYRCVYVPTHDTFEIILRVVGNPDSHQLYLRYIGISVVPCDWTAEVGLAPLPLGGLGGLPVGANSSPLLERVHEILATAVAAALASQNNPSTTQQTDSDNSNKQKRSKSLNSSQTTNSLLASLLAVNATMAGTSGRSSSPSTGHSSDSPGVGMTPRRSLDYTQLRSWLETRLASFENNIITRLDKITARLDELDGSTATAASNSTESSQDQPTSANDQSA